MSSFVDRIVRAAKLDANLYEEVEADTGAFRQAMGVVLLSALAAGIGSAGDAGAPGLIGGVIGTLIGWYAWAFVTYFIGTRLLPQPSTEADLGQLLRTIGFASAPGLIRVLGIIPLLSGVVFAVSAIWSLLAMIVAVRQALDYDSTGRAFAVCFIGWVLYGIVLVGFLIALGGAIGAGASSYSA